MTLLIDNNEPVQPGKNPSPKNIQISDEVYDVIDFFYPYTDYIRLPQLLMRHKDIMDIMNCSIDESYEICKGIREHFGEEDLRILIPHFCEYMDVDESFIHLFLMVLKQPRKLSRQQKLELAEPGSFNIARDIAEKLGQRLAEPNGMFSPDPETLRERKRMWLIANPMGEEPMCKPMPNFRMVIHSDEVAALCGVNLRTAQEMLKEIRDELKMKRKIPVSIRTFCIYFPIYNEEELRKGLAIMYNEKEEK